MNFNESQIGYLNEQIDSNTRLLAPAGCGKTITLLYRANRVVEDLKSRGVENPRVLIITFTNAARIELENKISTDGLSIENLTVCTLNKWGTERIKENFKPKNFGNRYHWMDVEDSVIISEWLSKYRRTKIIEETSPLYRKLVERVNEGAGFQLYNRVVKKAVDLALFSLIEAAKDVGVALEATQSIDDFLKELNGKEKACIITTSGKRRLCDIFQGVTSLFDCGTNEDKEILSDFIDLFRRITMDQYSRGNQEFFSFSDQKYWPLHHIRTNTNIDFDSYHHIFVDEFQDINALDLQLIKAISEYSRKKNGMGYISIVGDADQAIFEWRGAVPDYIIHADKHLENLKTHQLDRNYRMPANIVHHSQTFIRNNVLVGYARKTVIPMIKENAKIMIVRGKSPIELMQFSIKYAEDLRKQGKRVAILGRKRAQLVLCQTLMLQGNIKYYIDADINLALSASFSNLMICLQNHQDDIDNIMNTELVVDLLIDFTQAWLGLEWSDAQRFNIRSQMMERLDTVPTSSISKVLEYGREGGFGGIFWNIDDRLYAAISKFYVTRTVSGALSVLFNEFKGFQKLSSAGSKVDIFRLDPPYELLMDYSYKFGSDFAKYTELISSSIEEIRQLNNNADWNDDLLFSERHNEINLMTATRSKGREFDCVIMMDVINNVWPCYNPTGDTINMDEERRLFYVGMTRAKKELLLTIPEEYSSRVVEESPFISECKFGSDVIQMNVP